MGPIIIIKKILLKYPGFLYIFIDFFIYRVYPSHFDGASMGMDHEEKKKKK